MPITRTEEFNKSLEIQQSKSRSPRSLTLTYRPCGRLRLFGAIGQYRRLNESAVANDDRFASRCSSQPDERGYQAKGP